MAEAVAITAQPRDRAGKGAARATRRAGRVPGVIYGDKMTPELISLDSLDLAQQLKQTGFYGRVFEVQVGKKKHQVLAREIQFDPVTDRPLHVDVLRFSADTRLYIDVEVRFENEAASPGLKRGGVLNVVNYTIELICTPENIPPFITVDLTGLEIGASVHIGDIALPDGVQPAVADPDLTIATIAAPSLLEVEEEVEEEAEEAAEEAKPEPEEKAEAEE